MKYLRFSLFSMLFTVAFCSVCCALTHRVVVGSLAERDAAAAAAVRTVEDSAQWREFDVRRLRLLGISPRSYSVQGLADRTTALSVVVVQQPNGSFACDGKMYLGR